MEIHYQSHPDVIIGTNTFRNVRTIIQYEDAPMLEVGKFEEAGYSIRFPIYQSDGTKIAVVTGMRIHVTPDGVKAKVSMRNEINLVVCELEGKPILELRRHESPAMHGAAELYAPDGVLIKANNKEISGLLRSKQLIIAGRSLSNSVFDGCEIGIRFSSRDIAIGVGGSVHIGSLRSV